MEQWAWSQRGKKIDDVLFFSSAEGGIYLSIHVFTTLVPFIYNYTSS